MELVYKKTFKGVNEIATRADGLPIKLRPYLIIVDGNKSVKDLVILNPALKDLPQVLANLNQEGFIASAESLV